MFPTLPPSTERIPECRRCGSRLGATHRIDCELMEGRRHPFREVTSEQVEGGWFFRRG